MNETRPSVAPVPEVQSQTRRGFKPTLRGRDRLFMALAIAVGTLGTLAGFSEAPRAALAHHQGRQERNSNNPFNNLVVENGRADVLLVCAAPGEMVDLYFQDSTNMTVNGKPYAYNRNFAIASGYGSYSEVSLYGHDNFNSTIGFQHDIAPELLEQFPATQTPFNPGVKRVEVQNAQPGNILQTLANSCHI